MSARVGHSLWTFFMFFDTSPRREVWHRPKLSVLRRPCQMVHPLHGLLVLWILDLIRLGDANSCPAVVCTTCSGTSDSKLCHQCPAGQRVARGSSSTCGKGSAGASQFYAIKNQQGAYLSTWKSEKVDLWPRKVSARQEFYFEHQYSDVFYIKNRDNNKCLSHWNSKVDLWKCEGQNQLWELMKYRKDVFYIIPVASRSTPLSHDNDETVDLWEEYGYNQRWTILDLYLGCEDIPSRPSCPDVSQDETGESPEKALLHGISLATGGKAPYSSFDEGASPYTFIDAVSYTENDEAHIFQDLDSASDWKANSVESWAELGGKFRVKGVPVKLGSTYTKSDFMSEANRVFREENFVMVASRKEYVKWQVRLDLSKAGPNAQFDESVLALAESGPDYDYKYFSRFFDQFGTHILREANLGGFVERFSKVTSSYYEESSSSFIRECHSHEAGIKLGFGSKGSLSLGGGSESCAEESRDSMSCTWEQNVVSSSACHGGNCLLLACGDSPWSSYIGSVELQNAHIWPTAQTPIIQARAVFPCQLGC